jgi:endonuclease/exonuclease/phosphatase family metal-dependent hydrolase
MAPLRLATFNLLNGRSVSDGRVVEQRLIDAVRLLEADVLALQEVDRDQSRSGHLDLTAIAAEAAGAVDSRFLPTLVGTPGFDWQVPDPTQPDGPHYGIGLVSRRPVERWVPIDLGASPTRLPLVVETPQRRVLLVRDEPRVALAAVLAPGAAVRTVVATHLSFAPGWNLAQLRRLRRAVAPLPGPLVVLGDLNLPGWAVARLPAWRSLARTPTYPADEPRVQLDHILWRTADRAPVPRVVSTTPQLSISDHRALVVELG